MGSVVSCSKVCVIFCELGSVFKLAENTVGGVPTPDICEREFPLPIKEN
jgi:hypothetical protein